MDGTKEIGAIKISIAHSSDLIDHDWDVFLQGSPLGRYQQSSLWARVKAAEGYNTHRVVLRRGSDILGGFQILWKKSIAGRIGYVSQGPVSVVVDKEMHECIIEAIRKCMRMLGLQAVFVQPPEGSRYLVGNNTRDGFSPNYVAEMRAATLVVDVLQSIETIDSRMRRTTRQKIRQAGERGVVIREGTRLEIDTFFNLMVSTCRRRQVRPVPENIATFLALWDVFHPVGGVRLSFAEYDGAVVAGLVCICFGDRVTLWKRGWSAQLENKHPNELLMRETLIWSHNNGYKLADYGDFDREMAVKIIRQEEFTEEQKKSWHFFHLGLGGEPVLLPEGALYIRNPLIRTVYEKTCSRPRIAAFARRFIR
jgi:hypothetical protein